MCPNPAVGGGWRWDWRVSRGWCGGAPRRSERQAPVPALRYDAGHENPGPDRHRPAGHERAVGSSCTTSIPNWTRRREAGARVRGPQRARRDFADASGLSPWRPRPCVCGSRAWMRTVWRCCCGGPGRSSLGIPWLPVPRSRSIRKTAGQAIADGFGACELIVRPGKQGSVAS